MSHTQYVLYDVPKREKFNFPGLFERNRSDAVQQPVQEEVNQEEIPKKRCNTKKSAVEKPKKVLPFGTGKVF